MFFSVLKMNVEVCWNLAKNHYNSTFTKWVYIENCIRK